MTGKDPVTGLFSGKQLVTFYLDPEDYDRLRQLCEQEERAVSWMVRKAVKAWLDEREANG